MKWATVDVGMRHTLMVSSDSMYNEIEVKPESEDNNCNDGSGQYQYLCNKRLLYQ